MRRRIQRNQMRIDEDPNMMNQRLKKKDRKQLKQKVFSIILFVVRLLGSIVICVDSVLKYQYLVTSRFNSAYTRSAYLYFLLFRPVCIFFLIFYNVLFDYCKIARFVQRRDFIIEVEQAKVAKKSEKSASEDDNTESKRLLK